MGITPAEKLKLFFSSYRSLQYKKGDVILRAGDIPSGVYLLVKGYVRLYSVSQTGEELTLIIFKSGDFFPFMWAINETANDYYLEALSPVKLQRVPREKFLDFIKVNSDIFYDLTSQMMVRFGGLMRRMEYLVFGNAYEKIASILVICAERFGRSRAQGVVIDVILTHADVASLVGLTRETTSIEINKLKTQKLINYKGRHLVVRDLNLMRKKSLLVF